MIIQRNQKLEIDREKFLEVLSYIIDNCGGDKESVVNGIEEEYGNSLPGLNDSELIDVVYSFDYGLMEEAIREV
ncbi:MAG TPA: hypothetical protein VGA67_01165, partial [Candidatus Dojkabacteria bacterium]